MRMQYSAAVFGVELRTDIPGMRRKFHNLNQPAIGVLTYALHACSLVCIQISRVELIPMAMALAYHRFAINLAHFTPLS